MQIFVKQPEIELDPKSRLVSWYFTIKECEDVDFCNAIYDVESCYNCEFIVYDIETHYFIETTLPDKTVCKITIPKGYGKDNTISILKTDIKNEWLDKLLKF